MGCGKPQKRYFGICRQEFLHAQSWAALDGLATGERARTILRHATEDKDVLRVSFSTSFEWFRALEAAGLYDLTKPDMARWAALPGEGSTTCPETPENSRSECHAWSALPLYELIRAMAGIRYADGAVTVSPKLSYLPDLRGQVVTPVGVVKFDYRYEGDGQVCALTVPEKMTIRGFADDNTKMIVRRV